VRPGRLLAELRRRHVLRVVGAYAIAAWVVVEAYTTIHPILVDGYEWTDRFVVLLALAGLPIVFALAWIFDITPEGVRRTLPLEESGAEPVPGREVTVAGRRLTPRAAGFFGLGILVALASFAAYAGYQHDPRAAVRPVAPPAIESIAVLPFADMSPGHDQEYFADGITEELLNRLSTVPELRVAARTSSFAFKGHNGDVREIGQRLGVQSVLEGSVRRDGDRLRVSAKLIDAGTGYQLWTDSFDSESQSIFELQDQIATAVVDALRQHFAAAPEAGDRGTRNVRAYELYLLGLGRWNVRGDRQLRQALGHFRAAVEEDPDFAMAWAAMARTYAVLPLHGAYPADSAVLHGSAAAAAAIALDPSLGAAYAAIGQLVQNFDRDLHGAVSYYRRALQYNAGDVIAHQWLAEALMLMGRHVEAATHVNRVLAADPLAATSLHSDAHLRLLRGGAEQSLPAWRDLVRLHPAYIPGALDHALAAAAAGRRDEAAAAVRRLAELRRDRAAAYEATAAALERGRQGGPALAELERAGVPASERAAWAMLLGERNAALGALAVAAAAPDDTGLLAIMAHPVLAPLRGEARFEEVLAGLDVEIAG
jgi:TolB-like protein